MCQNTLLCYALRVSKGRLSLPSAQAALQDFSVNLLTHTTLVCVCVSWLMMTRDIPASRRKEINMHQIQIEDRQGSDSNSHRYRYIYRFYYIQVPVRFSALPLTIIMRASHGQLGGPEHNASVIVIENQIENSKQRS